MTDTSGAPAAAANVIASWKLIPHSAWPAAMSASGVALEYGRIWRSTPASRYQSFASATKNPVWLVFGVQSRARRTGRAGPADADADGDADGATPTGGCGHVRRRRRRGGRRGRGGPHAASAEEQDAEEGRAQPRMPAGAR